MSAELPEETARVYHPFLRLLQSPESLNLPDDTLFGAITHFLTVLPDAHLTSFTRAVVTSESLWRRAEASKGQLSTADKLRTAVGYAVGGKVARVRQDLSSVYFATKRVKRNLQKWLLLVVQAAKDDANVHGSSQLCFVAGLLEGVQEEKEIDWGTAREELELELATSLDSAVLGHTEVPVVLWRILPLLQESTLRVMDLTVSSTHRETLLIVRRCLISYSAGSKAPRLSPRQISSLL